MDKSGTSGAPPNSGWTSIADSRPWSVDLQNRQGVAELEIGSKGAETQTVFDRWRCRFAGDPGARKLACRVREGADGKDPGTLAALPTSLRGATPAAYSASPGPPTIFLN